MPRYHRCLLSHPHRQASVSSSEAEAPLTPSAFATPRVLNDALLAGTLFQRGLGPLFSRGATASPFTTDSKVPVARAALPAIPTPFSSTWETFSCCRSTRSCGNTLGSCFLHLSTQIPVCRPHRHWGWVTMKCSSPYACVPSSHFYPIASKPQSKTQKDSPLPACLRFPLSLVPHSHPPRSHQSLDPPCSQIPQSIQRRQVGLGEPGRGPFSGTLNI